MTMKTENAIVCPLIYQGTSFEDIAKALKNAADEMKLPVEFIGCDHFQENNLKAGFLDDEAYIQRQVELLGQLVKADHLRKILFVDFFQPGLDLLKYAFEQKGIECKFGSLLHGGTFLQGDLYSWGWLTGFERAWSGIYDAIYVPSKHLESKCAPLGSQSIRVFPWGMDGILPTNAIDGPRDVDVVFPHRLDADKGIEDLAAIAEALPECTFVVTSVQSASIINENPFATKLRGLPNVKFLSSQTREMHNDLLSRSKVVLSCARQENFGYAVMKAVERGCIPVLPKTLCYPEFFRDEYLYSDVKGAVEMIQNRLAKSADEQLQERQEFVRGISFKPLLEDFFQ